MRRFHLISVTKMATLAASGIVTRNRKESVRFYRLLGVDVPDPSGDHLDVTLPSGVALMWDTLELIKQLDPEWTEPQGHRMGLAFQCSSTGDVDATHARVVAGAFDRRQIPGTPSGVSATRRSSTPITTRSISSRRSSTDRIDNGRGRFRGPFHLMDPGFATEPWSRRCSGRGPPRAGTCRRSRPRCC